MLRVRWLGRLDYRESLDLQRQIFRSSHEEYLLLLEHQHVFTGGRNTDLSHLLVDPSKIGATYEQTDRGGDITYHGPGQLTGYPILSLPGTRGGGIAETKVYVQQLEQVLIDSLSELGLNNCGRLDRYPGVWVYPTNGTPRKIAAVGVRLSRGRTMHGFALNVATDLSWFDRIVPCGIDEYTVTSLNNEGINVSMDTVVDQVSQKAIETWASNGSEFAATAFPKLKPTDKQTISPGPAVAATASISFNFMPLSSIAFFAIRSIFSIWDRAASSGTTPPNSLWISTWLETIFDKISGISLFPLITATAVSSQLDSIPKIMGFFVIKLVFINIKILI